MLIMLGKTFVPVAATVFFKRETEVVRLAFDVK